MTIDMMKSAIRSKIKKGIFIGLSNISDKRNEGKDEDQEKHLEKKISRK
jgi:hypothetical protein